LLAELQARLKLSVIFISHNLGAVRHVSQRVAVMYLGRIVEEADEAELFDEPLHPYTHALLAAIPEPILGRLPPTPLQGEIPSALHRPTGCHFHPRCPRAEAPCRNDDPPLHDVGSRRVRCHFPG
jgi:oligopeptide/dipeptide ABC transporter ATP-binding protein